MYPSFIGSSKPPTLKVFVVGLGLSIESRRSSPHFHMITEHSVQQRNDLSLYELAYLVYI
jgi:hypothetical protein